MAGDDRPLREPQPPLMETLRGARGPGVQPLALELQGFLDGLRAAPEHAAHARPDRPERSLPAGQHVRWSLPEVQARNKRVVELTGQRFGRLVVLHRAPCQPDGRARVGVPVRLRPGERRGREEPAIRQHKELRLPVARQGQRTDELLQSGVIFCRSARGNRGPNFFSKTPTQGGPNHLPRARPPSPAPVRPWPTGVVFWGR